MIVGAVNGMGRWLVEQVLVKEPTLQLTLADIDPKVLGLAETLSELTEKVVRGRTVSYSEDRPVVGVDPSTFDVILLAVPIERMKTVALAVVSGAQPGCLVLDVASLKAEPLRHLTAAAPAGVSVLGTHPVFGPRVAELSGQTVVLCETETTQARHTEAVETLIRQHGGNSERLTPEGHDELMAVIQGLAHFVHLALAETIRTARFDLRETLRVQTPPFHSVAGVLGRLMNLSGERQAQLYASIQEAPEAALMRKEFLAAARHLDEQFENGDPDASSQMIETIARNFPASTVDHFSAQSDEAVRLRQNREIELRQLISTGEVCGFRDRDGDIKIGRLMDLDQTDLVLRGELVHSGGRVAAIYDEESREAAALFGIARGHMDHSMSRRHIRPLSPAELRDFRQTELDPHSVDLTLGMPRLVSGAALGAYLVDLIPELLGAELADVFEPEVQQFRQVTFRLRTVGDRLPYRVVDAVCDFVEVIGGERPRHADSPSAS